MIEKYDRMNMIEKARYVLLSSKSGKEIAEEMGMNVNQFYNYRNGFRKIEKAQLETLLKFEGYFEKYIENTKGEIDING